MPIQITNTLTGKRETFQPLEPNSVRMYVCGPTVYGLTHIGNARPAVFFDVVRRYLKFSGFKVNFVSNYTDVDDKIIKRAREESVSSLMISERYTKEYILDRESLGILAPDHAPKVTEHIPQIIKFIEKLIANQSAYVTDDGEVLFSVRKFREYGKLSKKNIDDLLVGVRIEADKSKQDPLDFSLWKPQKADDEPAWDSPWGKGRPGWHIECSAMSLQYLGETFDIHGGGLDLVHPHHENEIAQSEAMTGKPYVKIWMHNNLLNIHNEKMSKSLGNIFFTRDFVRKYTAETLKFLLLSGHYRSPIDFSEKNILDAQAALHRMYSCLLKSHRLLNSAPSTAVSETSEEKDLIEFQKHFESKWRDSMDDDFNTAKVIGLVFEYVRCVNAYADRKGFKFTETSKKLLSTFGEHFTTLSSVLNIFGEIPESFLISLRDTVLTDRRISKVQIEAKIQARNEARKAKNFLKADSLRKELSEIGIELRDTPVGTDWDVTFT